MPQHLHGVCIFLPMNINGDDTFTYLFFTRISSSISLSLSLDLLPLPFPLESDAVSVLKFDIWFMCEKHKNPSKMESNTYVHVLRNEHQMIYGTSAIAFSLIFVRKIFTDRDLGEEKKQPTITAIGTNCVLSLFAWSMCLFVFGVFLIRNWIEERVLFCSGSLGIAVVLAQYHHHIDCVERIATHQ